jgi:hypothetical protein
MMGVFVSYLGLEEKDPHQSLSSGVMGNACTFCSLAQSTSHNFGLSDMMWVKVSGTAQNTSGAALGSCAKGATCAFSGAFQVDTFHGTVESSGLDITFPGLPAFDTLHASLNSGPAWTIQALNSLSDELTLEFLTAPTPGLLFHFTGGTIIGTGVQNPQQGNLYLFPSGSIAPVPEPTSLVLLAGVIGSLVFGLTRRFRKKSAIH